MHTFRPLAAVIAVLFLLLPGGGAAELPTARPEEVGLSPAVLAEAETVSLMTRNHLPPEVMPIRLGPLKREGVGFGLGFSVRVTASAILEPSRP